MSEDTGLCDRNVKPCIFKMYNNPVRLMLCSYISFVMFSVLFCFADEELSDSPQWKKNCSLLQDTPVHKALATMRMMKDIV